ncbi:MAG: hypothetical protein JWM20_550 [Patescibacteria group bacterium]|nr:hypothetical protein [Patescibacteria group bacterium]
MPASELDADKKSSWFQTLKSDAEKEGVSIEIQKIIVDYSLPYSEAASNGDLSMGPGNDRIAEALRTIEMKDVYQIEKEKIVETTILLNWPEGVSYERAVAWGIKHGLKLSTPHDVFAFGVENSSFSLPLMPLPTSGPILRGIPTERYVCETTGFNEDVFGIEFRNYRQWRHPIFKPKEYFSFNRVWFIFLKPADTDL